MFTRIRLIRLHSANKLWRMNLSSGGVNFGPCSNCEIPCSKHVPSPPEILKQIDQSNMINSVEKHRRHLCIGQSIRPSQWPKHITNLQGDYIKELTRILQEKQDIIGYSIKLTSASVPTKTNSDDTADWYLFPDQLKISNVNMKQIDQVIQRLFVNDQSVMKLKRIEDNNHLPVFNEDMRCERLHGLWILVCCHSQRDQRCGVIGPLLVNEIEKYARETDRIDNIHWLEISHIGGHRFAGNVIVYPSGTWYGRVSTCHIPLVIDAYTSSSEDLKEKLKPLLRGYLNTT